jgi:hypothetical protein
LLQAIIQIGAAEHAIPPIDGRTNKILNDRFLIITPAGERKEGWEGFIYWCQRTKQPPVKTVKEYIKNPEKIRLFQEKSLLEGTPYTGHIFYKIYNQK